jgi:hypothetical protein
VHWDFNPESGQLLTEENPPRRWRIPIGRELVRLPQNGIQAWSGCFVTDTVLLVRKGQSLGRYDLSTPGQPAELPGYLPNNFCLVASHWPTGRFALAKDLNGEPFALKILENQGTNAVEKLSRSVMGRIIGLDFDRTGEHLAAVFQGGGLLTYATKSGEMLRKIPGKFERAVFAGIEGDLVALNAVAVKSDEVQYDLQALNGATGQPTATIAQHFRVNALAASPDRQIVAIGGADMTVHIFNAITLEEKFTFRAHDAEIGALAFHPSAPIVATASADGSVKLWDYRSAKLLDYFLGLTGTPTTVAFSPNGKLLLVDGQDKFTHIYDVGGVKAP